MLPRERVIAVLEHRKPDRVPLTAWLRANLTDELTDAYGSVEAFEDRYEFDLTHIIGHEVVSFERKEGALRSMIEEGQTVLPSTLMEIPWRDPDAPAMYEKVRDMVAFHKGHRGRFVYVQTPGIFEWFNHAFRIENHLMYLALYPDDLHELYRRQVEWTSAYANNCLDLGVDMIHVSDDWGMQTGLLFSPKMWWEMIYPYHQRLVEAVKRRGAYVSLHSDGNINAVMDGIVKLGYDVVHPWQESAGMDLYLFHARHRQEFAVMGGLDVQTTLGFGRIDALKREIERVIGLFAQGGGILCTTHFVQKHCSLEELKLAFDHAYDCVRSLTP